jgi:copper chaperone CopZ
MDIQVKYQVAGMTCGNCVKHVQAKLSEFAEDVIVTLDPPQAILMEPRMDMHALNGELAKIGNYRLRPQAPKAPIEIPELPSDKILRRAPTVLIMVVAAIVLFMLFFKK